MLQQRRAALHARILEAMERSQPGRQAEHIERLAYHALRGEVWDKAFAYLRTSALRAIERSAYREAHSTFRQVLQVLTHLPESEEKLELEFDVHLNLAIALRPLGELGQLPDHLNKARQLAESLGDRRRLGRS